MVIDAAEGFRAIVREADNLGGESMRMKLFTVCVLLALSACATPQSPPKQTAPTADKAASVTTSSAKDPDRIICKSEQETGTRLGASKTCMKAREWDEYEYQQMQNTRGYQNSQPGPSTSTNP